jgi:hypothetical protein
MTDELLFLPRPWSVVLRDGSFALNAATPILVPSGASNDTVRTAQALQAGIEETTGLRLNISLVSEPYLSGSISLRVHQPGVTGGDNGAANASGPESYRLQIEDDIVTLAAADEAGLYYGVQTLQQIVQQTGRRWPALEIEDKPVLRHRGLMLDVSRGKVPTLDTLKELARRLSRYRDNQLQLYVEHTFVFPSHPEIGAGVDALTANDILELDAVCRDHHIELVPNLQSIGHHSVMLNLPRYQHLAETPWKWSMATTSEEGFTILGELYDDLLPAFSSRTFNINGDEPWDLGRGQSRQLTDELGVGRVYLEHVKRIHRMVTERGYQMMMWADMFWHHPELIGEFPEDIILLDWWYEWKDAYDSVEVIAKAGRRFYVCPGTSSWLALYPRLENAIANVRGFLRDGIAAGCEGMLMTDWGDQGHFQPLSNSWYPYLWAAEGAWSGGAVESDAFDRAFGRLFLDDPSGRQVAAIRRLGAATQTDSDWHHSWHTAMALWEDPIAGRQQARTPPSVTAEAIGAANAAIQVATEMREPALRRDFGFAAAQVRFAALKAETTRAIHQLFAELAAEQEPSEDGVTRFDALIRRLEDQRDEALALATEFERRWLVHARPSQIEINRDRWRGLIARYDAALAWMNDQATIYVDGGSLDQELISYELDGYAILHDARWREIQELVEIVGLEQLPPDLQRYVAAYVP